MKKTDSLTFLEKLKDKDELSEFKAAHKDLFLKNLLTVEDCFSVKVTERKIYENNKGFGVQAKCFIPKGIKIFSAPLLELDLLDVPPGGILEDYVFDISQDDKVIKYGLAVGTVSLINHSDKPNAKFDVFFEKKTGKYHIIIFTKRDIVAGEEITMTYNPSIDESYFTRDDSFSYLSKKAAKDMLKAYDKKILMKKDKLVAGRELGPGEMIMEGVSLASFDKLERKKDANCFLLEKDSVYHLVSCQKILEGTELKIMETIKL